MRTTEQLAAENGAIREMLAQGAERQLRLIPGVLHVSVGLKETAGKIVNELCVRVYVREKKSREAIPAAELIPAEINGIPTDVHVLGVFDFDDDNSKYRPILGGIQVSNRIIVLNDKGTGTQMSRATLGCVAIDNTDDAPVILSNWHVLYGTDGRNGDKVYQPPPTSIPPTDLADLPKRPTDDTDKIAVLRRKEISAKVDGAIAAIDVSSCCHCCGIHFSNAINGLSAGGRPPRNTIVGDDKAVSGMNVFKVGKSTGRTEGLVVDDNYPSFDIQRGGVTYTFTGQIAIQNIDSTKPFSAHGDSGAVVINLDNKIVGLVFASGAKVKVKGVEQAFVSLANHISDVFAALKIRIPYSADVKVTSGETLQVVGSVWEAPIPEPYRQLRERLEANPHTAKLVAIAQRHSEEVANLVNHCRPVTVAWRRSEGPAFLASVMGAIRDDRDTLPGTIRGIGLPELLGRMKTVLAKHGSPALQATMNSAEVDLSDLFHECNGTNELIERIARNKDLAVLA